ncbi:hypothetical protein BJY52DRAFT_73352 [Lactarius psammicola]|nr:hypothetical protein BJY52DRAFT_73352 [Lactarius psammicola]
MFRRCTAAQSSLFFCAVNPSCALTWRCSSSRSSPCLEQRCPWILDSLLKPSRQVLRRMGSSVRVTTHDCTLSHRRGAISNA